ncbi:hypothetical protein [Shimia biformata]|uniref:hypothetical protein n=1 Tax=Shimia biformata TaxID=1294299 RepID=UPI00194E9F15|nr:hypothetical protein [Shimia biformata]
MSVFLTELEQSKLHAAMADVLGASDELCSPLYTRRGALAEVVSNHTILLQAYLNTAFEVEAMIEVIVDMAAEHPDWLVLPKDTVDGLYRERTGLKVELLMRLNGFVHRGDFYTDYHGENISETTLVPGEIVWDAFEQVEFFDKQEQVAVLAGRLGHDILEPIGGVV